MKLLHIEIRKDGIFLNPTVKIAFENTNFKPEVILFNHAKKHQWTCKMNKFDPDGTLYLTVLAYNRHDQKRFEQQVPKTKVKGLVFEQLHWPSLELLTTYHRKLDLATYISNAPLPPEERAGTDHLLTWKVRWQDLEFRQGLVCFQKKVTWVKEKQSFQVINPHIIKEFNLIKGYFAKFYNVRYCEFDITIISSPQSIMIKEVRSKQIESIDENTIPLIKTTKYKEWIRARKAKKIPQNQLLSIDEYIESMADESFGNLDFFEKEMLFNVLDIPDLRNARHLKYLVDQVQKGSHKISITLQPQFGFVFLHEGEEMRHYVWELLNSHATYIWSRPKSYSLNSDRDIIEQQVGLIKSIGRSSYRDEFVNSAELYFNRLAHSGSKSTVDDQFPTWVKRLHELLV